MKYLEILFLGLPTTLGLLFLKGVQSYFWMVWVRLPMKESSTSFISARYIALLIFLSGMVYFTAYLLRTRAFFIAAAIAFIGASFIADKINWGIRQELEFIFLWGFQLVAGVGAILIAILLCPAKQNMEIQKTKRG